MLHLCIDENLRFSVPNEKKKEIILLVRNYLVTVAQISIQIHLWKQWFSFSKNVWAII